MLSFNDSARAIEHCYVSSADGLVYFTDAYLGLMQARRGHTLIFAITWHVRMPL